MRIVVVDPSRTVLKIVTRLLEAGQHEVRPFTDGPEALAHIKADFDVDAFHETMRAQLVPWNGQPPLPHPRHQRFLARQPPETQYDPRAARSRRLLRMST